MQDLKDYNWRPVLFFLKEQITEFLKKYLPSEEINRHLDVISNNTPGESQRVILADHSPAAFHALVALGNVLVLIKGEDLSDEDPDYLIPRSNALGLAVMSFLAGFSLAHVIDEDMAQKILEYNAKFLNAGKRPRNTVDALDEVLDNVFAEHVEEYAKLPNWRQVIRRLEKMAVQGHSVIQEVEKDNEDEGRVFWKGSAEPTTFKRIRERLTPIRKKYSANKIIFPPTG